ncbi:hypothetical protein [Ferrovibrio terrae]|uniref:hypothetical protein n=1 Tax=Ferrovibrio terrae TaxID=2594003 RepID=UPI00313772A3
MKILLAACALLVFAVTDLAAQDAPRRLRAQIDSVDGQMVGLTTREGEKIKLALSPAATVTALVPATLDAIRPNSYIGTAAMPQPDGTLVALEVHIFTEAQRGAGEGHRPWDGGGAGSGSTMTNATVSTVMAARADARGRMLTLTWPGGDKQVLVPAGVPVVAFAPGERALVKPGNHVLVLATKGADGSYSADRITVGRDGLVPPM